MTQKKKSNVTGIVIGGKVLPIDWSKMPDDWEYVEDKPEEKKSDK